MNDTDETPDDLPIGIVTIQKALEPLMARIERERGADPATGQPRKRPARRTA